MSKWNRLWIRNDLNLPTKTGWYHVWVLGEEKELVAFFRKFQNGSYTSQKFQRNGVTIDYENLSHWKKIKEEK